MPVYSHLLYINLLIYNYISTYLFVWFKKLFGELKEMGEYLKPTLKCRFVLLKCSGAEPGTRIYSFGSGTLD